MLELQHLCVVLFRRRLIGLRNARGVAVCKLICITCRLAQGLADRLPAGGEASSKCESVGALLQAVRHEEAKVHIDLPALMKVSALVSPLRTCVLLLCYVRALIWMP